MDIHASLEVYPFKASQFSKCVRMWVRLPIVVIGHVTSKKCSMYNASELTLSAPERPIEV